MASMVHGIYLFMQNRLCAGETGYIAGFGCIRDLWRCHFWFCTARRVNHSTGRVRRSPQE